jgi:hypothetical protein
MAVNLSVNSCRKIKGNPRVVNFGAFWKTNMAFFGRIFFISNQEKKIWGRRGRSVDD